MQEVSNILIIGGFSKGAIENFYKKGFQKKGIKVHSYGSADEFHQAIRESIFNRVLNKISPDFIYAGINKRLLQFVENKKYDVILVFKGMELYEETVLQLKRNAVLLVNYNCDHPFVFYSPGSGNNNVKNSIPHYDIHFSYSKSIVTQLGKKYNKQAYFIPFGFDNDVEVKDCEIDTGYAERILFIGAYDKQRASFLNNLNMDRLDIYGDAKWKSRNSARSYILNAYKQKPLYNESYAAAVSESFGVINILRDQNVIENSHNMRTFEVPGYGGLLLSQRTSEQVSFFEEDKEAIFFDTPEELKEKIYFLRKNPGIAKGIKKAGYERSHRCKYGYDDRSGELLHFLNLHIR